MDRGTAGGKYHSLGDFGSDFEIQKKQKTKLGGTGVGAVAEHIDSEIEKAMLGRAKVEKMVRNKQVNNL